MTPAILNRPAIQYQEELEIAAKYFPIMNSRMICKDQIIVPRYSALPYYKELEDDLKFRNCHLINSFHEHNWIAKFDYYHDLKRFTPKSWTEDEFYKSAHNGPFVLKGKTNSRKHQWNTHMFAENRQTAVKVARELRNDMMIGEQGIIFREYVPLKTFEIGINGIRFANEWRFFYLKQSRLSYGYYWSSADNLDVPYMTEEGLELADKIAEICAEHATFFVLDIAEKEDGGWILIEVNDGSMSGLSENKPDIMYFNLFTEINRLVIPNLGNKITR